MLEPIPSWFRKCQKRWLRRIDGRKNKLRGFAGILNLDGAPADRALLERVTRFLAFRGADAKSHCCSAPEPLQFRQLAGAVSFGAGRPACGIRTHPRRANSNTQSISGFEWRGRMSMSLTISDRVVVVAAKDQVSCDLAGEAAILNIKNGVYYGLDPVGARIWNLMQQPRAVAEIQSAITDEYDVEPERCARDLVGLLEKLLAEGLIEVKDSTAA